MKMLYLKFHQNRPINEESYFFEGVREPLFINFYLNYYLQAYENVVFKISSK